MIKGLQETHLTNFETKPAQEMVSDVVPRVELRSQVYVFLELEPVQDFLLDPLELSPAAQRDGVPLVGLRVPLVQCQCSLPRLHSLLNRSQHEDVLQLHGYVSN